MKVNITPHDGANGWKTSMPGIIHKALNVVWFQCIWILAILWQNQWLGVLALLLTIHLVITPQKMPEIALLVLGGVVGVVLDSTLTSLGFFVFSPPPKLLPIPWWLVAVWFAFLGTLRHSLSYIMKSIPLAMVLGALFAPASYYAGMRLGAVQFGRDLPMTLLVLSGAWAILMPLLIILNRWLSQRLPIQ